MSGNELIGKSAMASSFLDTLGVNTHGGAYIDGYKNSSIVINSLKFLGIDSVRDSYAQYGQANSVLDAMAAAGVKFDFLVATTVPATGSAGLAAYIAGLKTFQAEHPGSLISVEGLNEINLNSFSYNGSSSTAAAAAFQQALYTAINADPALSKVAVLNLTVAYDSTTVYSALGDLGKYSDYANAHAYPNTGRVTDDAIQYSMDLAQGASKGDPIVVTETGYATLANTLGIGASGTAQAKLILNNLLNAYENGSVKTYMYELLDTPSVVDARGPKEAHFGLFNADGSPKLAATAVHNLTTILSFGDTGTGTSPGTLNYSFGAVPADTHSMLLGKSGGVQDLVVWTEKRVWNETTQQNISNPAVNVTVNFGKVESTVRVYDPLLGLTPIASYVNVSSIKIPLSDHPLIIELGAKSPVSVPVETVSANLSLSAAQLISQIDTLQNAAGLNTITLTDSRTLAVSSLETMNYMITHYGNVLDKISGSYNFSVTYDGATWRKTEVYNAYGDWISETDYGLKGNVVISKLVFGVDGSHDYYAYNIVGKSYVTEHQSVDAKGNIVALERWHADGTLESTVSKPVGGNKHYVYYDATGHKLNDVTIAVDGTTTTLTYNAATGKLARQVIAEADGDLFTGIYVNGIKSSMVSAYKTGDVETIKYDTSGNVVSDSIKFADGAYTTKLYTSGILTVSYNTHANGSQDNYTYHIKGTTYTTEHQSIDTKGNVVALERWHADGTLESTVSKPVGGDKHYVYYDATGHKLNDVTIAVDGTNTTLTYDTSTGKLARQVVTEPDHDLFTSIYVNGVKSSMVAAYNTGDIETIKYNASGVMVSDFARHPDGSYSSKLFNANGVLMDYDVKHANGSKDSYAYHITGQTYVTAHQTISAAGTVVFMERLHADGSYDYREFRGSGAARDITSYTASGDVLSHTVVSSNGSRVVDTNLQDGSGDVRHTVYNTATVLMQGDVRHKDGTHTLTAYADSQALYGGTGDDTFYFRNLDDGRMVYDGGNDTAWNFNTRTINPEHMFIDTSFASNFSHLNLAQHGNDVLITFDNHDAHDSVLLKSTLLANVTADSFVFG